MERKSKEEIYKLKKERLEQLNNRISTLTIKRNKLQKEIELYEMKKNNADFKLLEVKLAEKGMTLEELLSSIE